MTIMMILTCAQGFLSFIPKEKDLAQVIVLTQIDSISNQRNYNNAVIIELQYANDLNADFNCYSSSIISPFPISASSSQ